MSEKIVQFNEEIIKGQIKELVRGSVRDMKLKEAAKKIENGIEETLGTIPYFV